RFSPSLVALASFHRRSEGNDNARGTDVTKHVAGSRECALASLRRPAILPLSEDVGRPPLSRDKHPEQARGFLPFDLAIANLPIQQRSFWKRTAPFREFSTFAQASGGHCVRPLQQTRRVQAGDHRLLDVRGLKGCPESSR